MATRGFTPEVVDAYSQALELFERGQGAERQHYSVLRGLANLYMLRSEFDKAAEIGERILAIAEAEGDPRHAGSTGTSSSARRWRSPVSLRDGLDHLDTAIGLFKARPRPSARDAGRQRSAGRLPDDVGVLPVDARVPGSRGRAGRRGDRPVRPARPPVHLGLCPVPLRVAPPVAARARARPRPGDPPARDRRRVRLPGLVRDRVVPARCGPDGARPGRRGPRARHAKGWRPTRGWWRRRCSCRCSSSWTPARAAGRAGRPRGCR